MNPDEIRALIQELLTAIELVMQSGEELSDEFQGQIAETLLLLMERLELGQIGGAPPQIPPGIQSSNVAGSSYDEKTGDLFVQFLGKHPNRNGPIYKYPQTPPVVAELIELGSVPARTKGRNKWGSWWPGKVPSAGASVFTLLKNRNVPYQRLT